jgi:hypothetical protein
MSLLERNSSVQSGATDGGDEITKGSSHLVWTGLIAAVMVTIAVAVYFITGQKPPVATGQVSNLTAHLMHRETSGVDANGAKMAKDQFDQVLLFTHIQLHNQGKEPVFLRRIMANVRLDDGIHSSFPAIPADYERIFIAYPELAALHGKSIPSEATIAPGQTLEGDFVSAFRLDKEQWDGRKGLDYNVGLRYNPDLVLTPTSPISVR